jgi:glycerol-3-phosphate dehydrogenase (NAD(P)+)
MKIAYLGAGTWGIALASVLVENKHQVKVWDRDEARVKELNSARIHPKLGSFRCPQEMTFSSSLTEVLEGADLIVESITSGAIRSVFQKIDLQCPVILTSKGIEQHTMMLLPEVLVDIYGESRKSLIGCLSGPSHAEEVVLRLPTSLVASAYDESLMYLIRDLFMTPNLKIYPNRDVEGVSFGGAVKNVIAIACGIAEGVGYGDNAKAALMTRGLHEMRRLSLMKKAKPETLNGLSGMGDLCVTCMSKHSRNSRFGRLIAQGLSKDQAVQSIGMAVEGAYTCVTTYELAKSGNVHLPITENIYAILEQGKDPQLGIKEIFMGDAEEEHL